MESKLKGIVGLVHFVVILDNYGKRIYSKYYTEKTGSGYLSDVDVQLEFERKLCFSVVNLNVNKNNEGN